MPSKYRHLPWHKRIPWFVVDLLLALIFVFLAVSIPYIYLV